MISLSQSPTLPPSNPVVVWECSVKGTAPRPVAGARDHGDRWEFKFPRIPLRAAGVRDEPPFDVLLLACYTPVGVRVYRHDLVTGVRAPAGAAKDRVVQVVGPRAVTRWRDAFMTILAKLAERCKCVAAVPYDDERLLHAASQQPRAPTAQAFVGAPLAECAAATRTELLVALARRVDSGWLHPYARFAEPWLPAGDYDHLRSKPPKLDFEWRRDGRRVATAAARPRTAVVARVRAAPPPRPLCLARAVGFSRGAAFLCASF